MAANGVIDWMGEGVLLRLVNTLGVEQLRALPPIRVPQAVLDAIEDPAKYEELCRLDDRVPARGVADEAVEADTIEAALTAVRQVDTSAIRGLRGRLERLEAAPAAGPFYASHWSFEASNDLQSARELADDAAAACSGLASVRDTLAQARARDAEQDRWIRAARVRVVELIGEIEVALAAYHRFEVRLAEGSMCARRADCELEARKYRELAEQAAGIHAQLGRRGRLIGRGPSKAERARLNERLERIRKRQAREHTFIDERELRGWLDVLVDASLHLDAEQWETEAHAARRLVYQLLNVHCMQTLMRSEQLAVDTLLRSDAHERPGYCTAGEQYLGQYFAHRRLNDGGRDHAAGEGSEPFVRARATLLREYRASA